MQFFCRFSGVWKVTGMVRSPNTKCLLETLVATLVPWFLQIYFAQPLLFLLLLLTCLYLLRTLGVMSVPIIDFIQLRNVINTPFFHFLYNFLYLPGILRVTYHRHLCVPMPNSTQIIKSRTYTGKIR